MSRVPKTSELVTIVAMALLAIGVSLGVNFLIYISIAILIFDVVTFWLGVCYTLAFVVLGSGTDFLDAIKDESSKLMSIKWRVLAMFSKAVLVAQIYFFGFRFLAGIFSFVLASNIMTNYLMFKQSKVVDKPDDKE